MKKLLKAMSLSVILAAPLGLSQVALAQEAMNPDIQSRHKLLVTEVRVVTEDLPMVAQNDEDRYWRVFSDSKFDYWDAAVLAKLWGQDTWDCKVAIGSKLSGNYESKVRVDFLINEARQKALATADDLTLYQQSGFSYKDAEAMASFWGERDAWEGKLRIERNLAFSNDEGIRRVLNIMAERGR